MLTQREAHLLFSVKNIGDRDRPLLTLNLLPGHRSALNNSPVLISNRQVALFIKAYRTVVAQPDTLNRNTLFRGIDVVAAFDNSAWVGLVNQRHIIPDIAICYPGKRRRHALARFHKVVIAPFRNNRVGADEFSLHHMTG